MTTLRTFRKMIEQHFSLETEAVSWTKERHTDIVGPQIAIVMADPNYGSGVNREIRDHEEERLLDLLTTPGMPLIEIDRTPTRVWLVVTMQFN